MQVDLLWNGGIGTYVKASDESHAEVGDRANDAVRVNGKDLRCRVVGEGGNLGLSQRGRVEYALSGGKLNTDFVDNSGGVDCSDHEVNIKILLNNLPKRAGLTLEKRNKLLVDMTDEVAHLVLRDNYLQSQALSMLEDARSERPARARALDPLAGAGRRARPRARVPAVARKRSTERHKAGRGLTRPELAILLAYAKMALYSRLIDSDVPEDPYLAHELERYFPRLMQKRLGKYLRQHRLRREIIATATTNSMVNRMGPTFARRVQEDTGAGAATVVRAYAIARESFEMRATWGADRSARHEDRGVDAVRDDVRDDAAAALLHLLADPSPVGQARNRAPGVAPATRTRGSRRCAAAACSPARTWRSSRSGAHQYRAANVPEALAKRMASLAALRSGPDLVEIAEHAKLPVATAARVYFGVGTALSLDWIREQIEALERRGPLAGRRAHHAAR